MQSEVRNYSLSENELDLDNLEDIEQQKNTLSIVIDSIKEKTYSEKEKIKKLEKENEELKERILNTENNLKIQLDESIQKLNELINQRESMNQNLFSQLSELISLNENSNSIDRKMIEKIIDKDLNTKEATINSKIEDLIKNLYLFLNKPECENPGKDFQKSIIQDSIQNQQVEEYKKLKDSLDDNFSKLNEKLDSKCKLDSCMSLNNQNDRENLFKIVMKEINELKNMIINFQSSSEMPASLSENSIFLRFESMIPIYEESLIQNIDPGSFKTPHSPEWLCNALFDVVKKNKLNSNAINKVFEILNKILCFLKDDQLNLVEELLDQVKNEKLLAKYDLLYQFISMHPHRKFKLIQIFIRDLEFLINDTNDDVLDDNYQLNNPQLYLSIKKILKMANYTVSHEIDLDTINVLKRNWVCSRLTLRKSLLDF